MTLGMGNRIRVHRTGPEIRHARAGPPALGISDPVEQPSRSGLAGDAGQRGPAPGQVVVALDGMAPPAAHVGEELLALRHERRVRERELLVMALVALRLHERALVLLAEDLHFLGERVVPVVVVLAMAELAVHDALGLRAL